MCNRIRVGKATTMTALTYHTFVVGQWISTRCYSVRNTQAESVFVVRPDISRRVSAFHLTTNSSFRITSFCASISRDNSFFCVLHIRAVRQYRTRLTFVLRRFFVCQETFSFFSTFFCEVINSYKILFHFSGWLGSGCLCVCEADVRFTVKKCK